MSFEYREIESYVGKLLADATWLKAPAGAAAAVVGIVLPDPAQRVAAVAATYLVSLDAATGVMAARLTGEAIRSAKLARTLVKLLGYASVVSVAGVAAKLLPNTLPGGAGVSGVLALVVATEGVSILENVRKMGVPLPPALESWLEGRRD